MQVLGQTGKAKLPFGIFGVSNMTTEEELEQRVNILLDDRQKELEAARAAIQKLELKNMSEAVDRLNEIFNKGGDRG